MAANLIQHQRRLNRDMPLVLMTDDRDADWAAAARNLPQGSLVVVRARDAKRRVRLVEQLSFARLLVADDPELAAEFGIGLHLPERRMREARHWRVRYPHWIITASVHSLGALLHVRGLDGVFLSPVFATTSHRRAMPLTPVRAALIAAQSPVPVYALGGITPCNATLLAPAFSGIAAISSLL